MIDLVLDPGHGGHSPVGSSTPYGARGPSGTLEKDVNLELARAVSRHLGGLGVAFTREGDTNLSLAERQAVAGRARARTLISLHTRARGEDGEAAEVWVHERSVGRSRQLAEQIGEELSQGLGMGAALRSGPLALLHPAGLPDHTEACLVEVGALEDAHGERQLRDPVWLDQVGAAIARGVRRHYGLPLALHPGAWAPRLGGDVQVGWAVTLIPQPTTWGCWAASASMVLNAQRPGHTPQGIAAALGFQHQLNVGLSDEQARQVAVHYGLEIAPLQNWTVQGFADLLAAKGPLWVSTNPGGSVHDICVYGIEGDGGADTTKVFVKNPWPPNVGASQELSYRDFVAIYERRASGNNLVIHARHAPRSAGRRLGAHPGSYGVIGAITPIQQPTQASCWATTFAMMLNWKQRPASPYTPRGAVATAGARWATQYDRSTGPNAQGLPWDDYPAFARDAGLTMMAPRNMTAEGWVEFFESVRGPIWIGHIPGGPAGTGGHAWVLEGIEFDGTDRGSTFHFVDPASGRRETQPFLTFVQEYEERYRRSNGHPHVLHW